MGEYRKEGPELTALIAQKVMGWTRVTIMDADSPRGKPRWVHGFAPSESSPFGSVAPLWSEEIIPALAVVDAMARLKPHPWMATITNWNHYGERWWKVVLTTHALGPKPVEVENDSLPLAICLAALKALEAAALAKAQLHAPETPTPLSPEDMTDGSK